MPDLNKVAREIMQDKDVRQVSYYNVRSKVHQCGGQVVFLSADGPGAAIEDDDLAFIVIFAGQEAICLPPLRTGMLRAYNYFSELFDEQNRAFVDPIYARHVVKFAKVRFDGKSWKTVEKGLIDGNAWVTV